MNEQRLANCLTWLILATFAVVSFTYSSDLYFSLIDDYGEAEKRRIFDSLSSFVSYIESTFFRFEPVRFRPALDLVSGALFKLFPENHLVHHAFRILLKIGTVLIAIMFLKGENVKPAFIMVFVALSLLHPNMPEIRLAPVELPFVLFMFSSLVFLKKAFKGLSGKLLLLSSLVLMVMSKEIGVVIMAYFGWYYFLKSFSDPGRSLKNILGELAVFFAILFYFSIKILSVMKSSYVAGSNLTIWKKLFGNVDFLFGFMPFNFTYWILFALCLGYVINLYKKWGKHQQLGGFLFGIIILFVLISLKFPYYCLRYYYPLTLCFLLFSTLAASNMEGVFGQIKKWETERFCFIILILLILNSSIHTVPHWINQWAFQIDARSREHALIKEVLREKKDVSIVGKSEFESKLQTVLTNKGLNVRMSSQRRTVDSCDLEAVYVSQEQLDDKYFSVSFSSFTKPSSCKSVSPVLGGRYLHDCGAPLRCNMREWRIYKCL